MGLSGFVPLSLSVGRSCVRPSPKRTRRQRGADHRRRSVNPPNRIRDVVSAGSLRHATKGRPARNGMVCTKSLRGRCPPPSYCIAPSTLTGPEKTYTIFVTAAGPSFVINIVTSATALTVLGTIRPLILGPSRNTWPTNSGAKAQVHLYRICYRRVAQCVER